MSTKNIELLPHNEEAFEKLKDCLNDNQLVAINHATGTGKSFILLKYLYENRNKRILYLSPSYPINDQLVNEHAKDLGIDFNEFIKFDTLIYRTLLGMNMEEIASNYDIIVLDEYHRCGAKKWGIKVNELLDIVKKNHPDIKVIGTTATEIRYLDNEKNMNNILFDGVCASTLTLADAILKEILPVPIYINSIVDLGNEFDTLERKVYKKTLFDREKEYYLKIFKGIRKEIDEIIDNEEDITKYVKKDGKHLVFSTTIDSIPKDKRKINKLLGENHNEYEVHSGKSHEHNAKALKNFREDANPAALYCINILNEGVHVKDVDSIFMLRPTSSPIIFFQQLGRLLSYSSRKDTVVVFDLVNNMRRNPHIYQLSIDLYKRAQELIKEDPENSERYLKILDRFKIVDATSEIYDKLDKLKNTLSKENFYKKRIDFIIEILKNKGSGNQIEEQLATLDLFMNYKYMTIDQFKIIKGLDCDKPLIFDLSLEEYTSYLNGEETIFNKEKNTFEIVIREMQEFYATNGYFPSILSSNIEEQKLASKFIEIQDIAGTKKTIFENKNIDNISEYEKVIYGIETNIDINKLYNEIDKLILNNLDISSVILVLIRNQKTEISKEYIDKIIKYNASKTNVIVDDNRIIEEDKELKSLYTEDYKIIAKECMEELKKYDSIESYIKELADDIIEYIKRTQRMPVYYLAKLKREDLIEMRTLYVKKMVFYEKLKSLGYLDLFEEVYNSIMAQSVELNKSKVVEKIVEFLKTHNGDMPSVSIEEDKTLANEYNKILTILDEDDKNLINSYRAPRRAKIVALKYIAFVKQHKRYPLITSTDEEEKALMNDYIRNEPYFNDEEKALIRNLKKFISQKEAMQNAYMELLAQRKGK